MDDSSPSPSSSTSPSTTSSAPYTSSFGMASSLLQQRRKVNGGGATIGMQAVASSSPSSSFSPDREGTVESQESSTGVLGVMEGMEGMGGGGGGGGGSSSSGVYDWHMEQGFDGMVMGEDIHMSTDYINKVKQEDIDFATANVRYQDDMLDFTTAMLAPEIGGGVSEGNNNLMWPRAPFASTNGGFASTSVSSSSDGLGGSWMGGNGNISGTITPHAGMGVGVGVGTVAGMDIPNVPRHAQAVVDKGPVSMLDKVSGGPMLASTSAVDTTIQHRRQHMPTAIATATMTMAPLSTSLDSGPSSLYSRGKGIKALTSTSSTSSISAADKPAPTTGKPQQVRAGGAKSAPVSMLNTPAASTEEEGKVADGHVDTAGWNVVYPEVASCERLPILIRGIKRKGAKSRVETQIKMKISIVQPSASYPSDVPYPSAGGPSAIDILTPPSSASSRLANLPSIGIGLGHRPSTSSASTSDSSPDRASLASNGGPPPFDKVGTFKAFKLQKGTGMKRRGRKTAAGKDTETSASESGKPESGMLYLQTEVYCVESGKRAYACAKCRARELKRTQSKIANRVRPSAGSDSDDASVAQNPSNKSRKAGSDTVLDGSDLPPEQFQAMGLDPANPPSPPTFQPEVEDERHNIVVFNCGPIVEMEDGECELPGRVTCYCRHHKEKQGFRLVLTLRDMHGKVVASGTTPPIMITDDHKTSGRTSASAIASTDGNVSATAGKASGSTRPRPGKKSREGSVSTEDSRISSSRPTKSKPYDRKPPSQAASIPALNGTLSPRSSFAPHGLSMTPLHGRSMPGSPLVATDPRTSYFSPTGMTSMNLPGSGAITPSLLQSTGLHQSRSTSPQGLAQALPAISETLSAWAGAGGADRPNGAGIYGLGMDTGPPANAWMQMEDDRQTFSSDGDGMPGNSDVLMEAATLESLRLDAMQGFSPNGMDGFQGQGNQLNNGLYSMHMGAFTHDSPSSASAPSTGADLDADFSSMINFSPTSHAFALPVQQGLTDSWSPHNGSQNGSTWSGMLQQQQQQHNMYMPHQHQRQQQQQPPPPRIPAITRLVPAEGPTVGGIEVTVLGENFTPGMICSFGAMSAVTVQHYGPTTLVCLLPPSGHPGQVSVTIHDPQSPTSQLQAPGATFTYQDVSDRKLMEMALTAVGLRVTGKVHGAVEIARRIMSAPDGQNGNGGSQGTNTGQQQQQHSAQHPDAMAAEADEERLAEELARSIYSGNRLDFETAIIRFLGAFIQGFGNPRVEGKRRGPRMAAVNHINGEGQTILHLAAFLGMEQLVRLLLRADATVDIHDRNGYTALSFATIGRRASVVRFLLASGAKPHACAFSGATPRSLALQSADAAVCTAYGPHLHDQTAGQISHRRRPSTSDSSLDGDNPSSADDAESAAFDFAASAMSPRKLTTQDDVKRARSSSVPSMLGPKSDGSATPTIKNGRSVRAASEALPQVDEHPPPYAAGDAANWLHRTLSHLPASSAAHLKEYIPPSLWDKIPSAHVLVPNMQGLPATTISDSQAWLAVPLSAWLHLFPGMSPEAAQRQQPPSTRVALKESSPAEPVRATASTSNPQKRRTGERSTARTHRRSPGSSYGGEKREMDTLRRGSGDTVVNEKKPDRMLFLFWLPILMVACIYTAITTVPVLLGRVLILPMVRILGRG